MHTDSQNLHTSSVEQGDDESLVQRAKQDQQAFVEIYRRYVILLYRYIYSRVGNKMEAEDLTSQVFEAVLANLNRVKENGNLRSYLFTIARNKVTDTYRKNKQHLSLADLADQYQNPTALLAEISQIESLEHLGILMDALEPERVELLRLRFAGELTYAQIAQVVGSTEAAVKMAIRRLLHKLQQELEKHDE